MRIAVIDTNIFIDLIKTGLLQKLFETEFLIHTTAEVVNELLDHQQQALIDFIRDKNLIVSSLSSAEITALELKGIPAGLSPVDMGIFFYAKSQENYLVLSNDNLLRKVCLAHQIEVHGILWLMDLFLENKLCKKTTLYTSLQSLLRGFNRLPANECKKRLIEWQE